MLMETPRTDYETLFGGVDMEVTLFTEEGKTVRENVKVCKVSVRGLAMASLSKAWGRIDEEARVYVPSKDEAWHARLTDESLLAIAKEGRRLNEKSFVAWVDLQTQAAEAISGERIKDKVKAELEK